MKEYIYIERGGLVEVMKVKKEEKKKELKAGQKRRKLMEICQEKKSVKVVKSDEGGNEGTAERKNIKKMIGNIWQGRIKEETNDIQLLDEREADNVKRDDIDNIDKKIIFQEVE